MTTEISPLPGGSDTQRACSDCGLVLQPGTSCFRCVFRRGEATDEDREVHARAVRRAVFELRATMTWQPRSAG
jgi:hypothetical protein